MILAVTTAAPSMHVKIEVLTVGEQATRSDLLDAMVTRMVASSPQARGGLISFFYAEPNQLIPGR